MSTTTMSTNQMMVLLVIAVVVVAAAYWYWSGAAASAQVHSPRITPAPRTGELIDKYDGIVSSNQFMDAVLRATRENKANALRAQFIAIAPPLSEPLRREAGVALDEMSRINSTQLSTDQQKQFTLEHDNAMNALKARNETGLSKAIDALRRLGSQPGGQPGVPVM